MTAAPPSIRDTRRHQMFPTLESVEIERLRRFGEERAFAAGEPLAKMGEVGRGLIIVLSGKVAVSQRNRVGPATEIVTHGPGAFLGELAQLSDRPALIVAPERLRALLVAEAEVGERIMRALILRRVGLLETGAGGPVIVGHAESGDVLR